jgi:hypothetical protein
LSISGSGGVNKHVHNVIFQHPVALNTSDLGVFATCFGLTGHLQVYRLLWSRILLHCNAVLFSPIVVVSDYFDYVSCTWLLLVSFGLLVVAALSVLSGVGVLLCAGLLVHLINRIRGSGLY